MNMESQITLIASLGAFLFGADSGLINKIQTLSTFKQQFDLDSRILSLIVMCGLFGCMVGSISCGYLADKLGRRNCMVLMSCVFLVGTFVQIMSGHIYLFLFGRFVGGIAIGSLYTIAPMYVGEVCSANKRGMLVSAQHLAIAFANLLVFVIVYNLEHARMLMLVDWQLAILIQIIPVLLLIVGCLYIPKSPRWLIMKNDYDGARKALQCIYKEHDKQILERFNHINDALSLELKQMPWKQVIRIYWRRLLMGMTLQMFKRLSGVNALLYYSTKLFLQVIPQYANEMSILQNILNFIFTAPSIVLTDRVGRRSLLIFGAIGCCLGLFMTGTGMLFNIPILAVIGVFFAVINFAYSLGPVPLVVCVEIFPLQMRSRGQAACMTSNWLFTLLVNSLTPLMIDSLHAYTFYLFSSSCFIFVIWLIVELPETKGMSLEEVNEMLNRRHRTSSSIRSFEMNK